MGNKLKNFGLIAALVLLGSSIAFSDYIKSGAERVIDSTGLNQEMWLRTNVAGTQVKNLTLKGTGTGQVLTSAGTAVLPALGINDSTAGFYDSGTDRIGVTAAGVQVAEFNTGGLVLTTAGDQIVGAPSDSAGVPSITFSGVGTTGIFADGLNLGLTSQGSNVATVDPDTINLKSGMGIQLDAAEECGSGGNICSGEYTVVESGASGLDSTPSCTAQYMRVGNYIQVGLTCAADLTSGGDADFDISLPFTSGTFSANGDASGPCVGGSGTLHSYWTAFANVGAATVKIAGNGDLTSSHSVKCSVMYEL